MAEHKPYIDAAINAVFLTMASELSSAGLKYEDYDWADNVSEQMKTAKEVAEVIAQIGNAFADGYPADEMLRVLGISPFRTRHMRRPDTTVFFGGDYCSEPEKPVATD